MLNVHSEMRGPVSSCSPASSGAISMFLKWPTGRRVIVLGALLALAASPALAQQRTTFKCKDAKGKFYYTQTPPPECIGKEMQELNPQGAVVGKREAALTAEQYAAREADAKRKKDEEIVAKEEARKNVALLNTYSSEKDIEDSRARALAQAEEAITQGGKRIVESRKRQKELAAEKEFYVKNPMPKKLQDDIKNNEIELKGLEDLLLAKKKELGEINAKYDEDKRRYIDLTKSKGKPTAPPAAAAQAKKN
jgi:hypothetical protein